MQYIVDLATFRYTWIYVLVLMRGLNRDTSAGLLCWDGFRVGCVLFVFGYKCVTLSGSNLRQCLLKGLSVQLYLDIAGMHFCV